MLRPFPVLCAAVLLLAGPVLDARAPAMSRPPTLEDAIALTHIQRGIAKDGSIGAFSPDGRRIAVVTWRGDLTRDVNIHTLLVFEIDPANGRRLSAREFLDWPFNPNPLETEHYAISQVQFLPDNRTLVFLGRRSADAAQVFALDVVSGTLRQLTHHPTSVRDYGVDGTGAVRFYSAVADREDEAGREERLASDGMFLWDRTLFRQSNFGSAESPLSPVKQRIRQYFIVRDGRPERIFDSRQSALTAPLDFTDPEIAEVPPLTPDDDLGLAGNRSGLDADPRGRYGLFFPYILTERPLRPERWPYFAGVNAFGRRMAGPYGLVDLKTGQITPLIDAPQIPPRGGRGRPFWSPDGRSVIVHNLPALDGPDRAQEATSDISPAWFEIGLASRSAGRIAVPAGWRVLGWSAGGDVLILQQGARFARIRRLDEGKWGIVDQLGEAHGLSERHGYATNGRFVLGVTEDIDAPETYVLHDLRSGAAISLGDLNPSLSAVTLAKGERIDWRDANGKGGHGFLVLPPSRKPAERVPLVIMLRNLSPENRPFLFDGAGQLSADAIQMLAAKGIASLVFRVPSELIGPTARTGEEGAVMCRQVQAALARLDSAVDTRRVGISGLSRSGFYVDSLLIDCGLHFAAASQIDGGSLDYLNSMRPFSDVQLRRIGAPLLMEPHNVTTMVNHAAMADRLTSLGKPVEILYFREGTHDLLRARHRYRSMAVHLDWWNFWLNGTIDPDPCKADQYRNWQRLRDMRSTATTGAR